MGAIGAIIAQKGFPTIVCLQARLQGPHLDAAHTKLSLTSTLTLQCTVQPSEITAPGYTVIITRTCWLTIASVSILASKPCTSSRSRADDAEASQTSRAATHA